MDSSIGGERSDQEKQKRGRAVSTEELLFWQNRQKLAIKIKRWKINSAFLGHSSLVKNTGNTQMIAAWYKTYIRRFGKQKKWWAVSTGLNVNSKFLSDKSVLNSFTTSGAYCASIQIKLHVGSITFWIFVCWQCLTARNVAELFSYNHGVSHFYAARRIDELSRGSISGYKILANN